MCRTALGHRAYLVAIIPTAFLAFVALRACPTTIFAASAQMDSLK